MAAPTMTTPFVRIPERTDIAKMLPHARLENGELLVPHGPAEVKILRSLGHDVPSSLVHYDWCGWQPFRIQIATTEMLVSNQRGYVLNSMGTGKTKCVLWAYDHLRQMHAVRKMLVVAPLSTLRFVWGNEILMTTPQYKFAVLHGDRNKRLRLLDLNDIDIYIINHDGFKIIAKELAARPDIDVICFDELAAYRNKTERTKVAASIAQLKPVVWGLTGAPTPNAPTDTFWQAKVITPKTVPKYWGMFRDELMYRVSQFKWLPKNNAIERAIAVLQPSVRFTLDDVVELPEFVSRNVEVELSDRQRQVYREIQRACVSLIDKKQITAVNAGAVMTKLLQISLGWVYADGHRTVDLDARGRQQALIDLCEAAAHKVLVFVPYKHALHGLRQALTKAGRDVACVSGDTSPRERSEIFNAFQNTGQYTDLLAHPGCVAHGLTLTAADTVIWFGPVTSSEVYEQANARIRRVGQQHRQLFLHLQASPVERKLYGLLINKVRVQDRLLELIEEMSREMM
jgi:SNF2 family DNA or RNA helicase